MIQGRARASVIASIAKQSLHCVRIAASSPPAVGLLAMTRPLRASRAARPSDGMKDDSAKDSRLGESAFGGLRSLARPQNDRMPLPVIASVAKQSLPSTG